MLVLKLLSQNYIIKIILVFMLLGRFEITDGRKFPIAVVFDDEKTELQSAFKFAIKDLKNYSLEEHGFESELTAEVNYMAKTADSCGISQYVQAQVLRGGILAIVCGLTGSRQVYSFLSHTNRLQIPFIAPKIPMDLVDIGIGLGIRLQPIGMYGALLDLITHYGYKKFIYLYNGYEGIHGLQAFHDRLNAAEDSISIAMVRKFGDTAEALEILEHIESTYRWTFKLIVLDCAIPLAKKVLLGHVADRSLGRRTYHYLISGYAFDEYWSPDELIKVSYLNVTGFRIVNPERPYVSKYLERLTEQEKNRTTDTGLPIKNHTRPILTAHGAFLYDCILVLQEGFSLMFAKENTTSPARKFASLLTRKILEKNGTEPKRINPLLEAANLQERKDISQQLKNVRMEGLTGAIQFTESGIRVHYSMDVMKVNMHGEIEKVGEWSDTSGFIGVWGKPVETEQRPYIMTSLLEEPMLTKVVVAKGEPEPKGNEMYEGFAKEFMDLIAERLNISYVIKLAKDGKHGSQNPSMPGGWDGMVGELVRYEADIAMGGLTVNAEREVAIHLSKPFMFVGISIMIFKASSPDQLLGIYADVFEFMRPLARDTWICVAIAYLGVCLVLFSIGKYNKKELETVEKHGLVKVRTQFSISNSIWFTFASLVSQGTDICPRSVACRLVGSVWWFFTLILISSYTANFAAFQTMNRMVQPINSVSDLIANQKKVTYGLLDGGSTQKFFKKTSVLDYQKMDAFMSSTKGCHVKTYEEGIARVRREEGKYAFILESLKNEYTNRRKPCNTMRVGGNLDLNGFAVGLSKSATLRVEDINRIILEFRGSGLIDSLQNKWWPPTTDCDDTDENIPKEERGRLSLKKLAGVFYVLIGGVIIALLIAVYEVWSRNRRTSKSAPLNPAPEVVWVESELSDL